MEKAKDQVPVIDGSSYTTEMNFKLTKPCQQCPFLRKDTGYLTKKRITGIVKGIEKNDEVFPCHKTINYVGPYEAQSTPVSACAGALAFMEIRGTIMANWRIRFARGRRLYDPARLERSKVCTTLEELTKRHCY